MRAVLLLCLALLLTACGTPLATATPKPAAPVATATTPRAASAAPASEAKADQIAAYLRANFGTAPGVTSWYPLITSITTSGNTATVGTTVFPDAEGKKSVTGLCSAVSVYIFGKEGQSLGLTRVRVMAQNGQVVLDRNGVNGTCG